MDNPAKSESTQLCKSMVYDLVQHVEERFGKAEEQMVEGKYMESFSQLFTEPHFTVLRRVNVKQESTQKFFPLLHYGVLYQHVDNLCGYHALYNALTSCQILDSAYGKQDLYNDSFRFWYHTFKVQKLLIESKNLLDGFEDSESDKQEEEEAKSGAATGPEG